MGRRSMQLASSLVASLVLTVGSVVFTSGSPARAADSGPVIALLAVSCPDASAVPANAVAQPSVDDTGGAYHSWGSARSGPVSTGEANDCTPRSGVTFRLSSVDRGAALSTSSGSRVPVGSEDGETTTIVGTTGSNGLVIMPVANLTASQLTDLERGNNLWVSGGAGAGFLGLRCHTDMVNSDDLEYLRVAPFAIPGQLSCIHYSQGAAPTPPPTTSTTLPVTQPSTSQPPVPTTVAPPATTPMATTATTHLPATTSTTRPATTTTRAPATNPTRAPATNPTRAPATTTTRAPATTSTTQPTTEPGGAPTSTTTAGDDDTETALPATPARVLVRVAAPGSGPLSASLTTVWTQDLVLSLVCGAETMEIRITPTRDVDERGVDVPPHLLGSTCDLMLKADGVDGLAQAGLARITVDGTHLAEGETTEVDLDGAGPTIDAVYAAVGDESVLPELIDPTDTGGGDRLPVVPVGIGLLVAALAGGILVGRTSNRG